MAIKRAVAVEVIVKEGGMQCRGSSQNKGLRTLSCVFFEKNFDKMHSSIEFLFSNLPYGTKKIKYFSNFTHTTQKGHFSK